MKYDLSFSAPLLNAAGILGFAPDPYGLIDLTRLGAFVTNPISAGPHSPARGERCLAYPGGFLLHTGYPNPGVRAVLKRYAGRWERSALPVLVHLLAESVDELAHLVRRLEGLTGVMGFEIGLPPEADAAITSAATGAAVGELPVVVRLPLERAVQLAPAAAGAGAAAVSLGAPRGVLPAGNGKLVSGRLFGPAVFPQALGVVQALTAQGIRVIGAGGLFSPEQVETMLAAGALAVQLDAIMWRGGWQASP